jgi:hypothetical protein
MRTLLIAVLDPDYEAIAREERMEVGGTARQRTLGNEEVVAFTGQIPHAETWQMPRMVYDAEDHVGGALIAMCDDSARVRDWGGAPKRDGARDVRKEPDSMRATQFVRRGLVAFAAVATLTLGLSGVASAQSPGAVVDGDDAIVYNPVLGYVYDIVHTDGERTAVLAVGVAGGNWPVVVEFIPDFNGAAVITPGEIEDVVAERVSGE